MLMLAQTMPRRGAGSGSVARPHREGRRGRGAGGAALGGRLSPGGTVQIGRRTLRCALQVDSARDVKVYLRPEDVLARPIEADDVNVFDAEIEKIEFLGSYCHVSVRCADLDAASLVVYLSLNFLVEQGLQPGSRLPLRILPDRIRAF